MFPISREDGLYIETGPREAAETLHQIHINGGE